MQRQQQGFTLIELVIVIVILGILSAFALPRFADLGGDARQASIEGAAGSVRSAASVTRSAWLAAGEPDSPITLSDGSESINVTDNGYPTVEPEGIIRAAQISADDYDFDDSLDPSSTTTMNISIPDASGDCGFQYDQTDGSVSFDETGTGKDC